MPSMAVATHWCGVVCEEGALKVLESLYISAVQLPFITGGAPRFLQVVRNSSSGAAAWFSTSWQGKRDAIGARGASLIVFPAGKHFVPRDEHRANRHASESAAKKTSEASGSG